MSVDATLSFEEAMEKYDPVLGFEVHVELNTKTKMFSSAPNVFGDEPNTNVNEVDLGMPGVLPVVNKTAVESSIKIGLALNCKIAESCRFARKNYFYPDTPKNFQTSQYDEPIAYDGYLDIELEDGTVFRVEIERAHMEEDAGKLTHMGGAAGRIQGADYSLVDYNRSGVPLVEIVTKPIEGAGSRAPELAKAYVAAVREIVKNLGVSDAKMERGNVRCDANVSLRPHGRERFGIRSETKNVNSLRAVEHAVRYEIQRMLPSWNPASRSSRRHATGTRIRVRRRQAGPSPTLTITATSRSRTWFPSSPPASGWRSSAPPFRNRRPSAASASRKLGATPTWNSATSSTRVSWTPSRRPSQQVRPLTLPASGGWARSSDVPRSPTSILPNWASPRR